MVLGYLDIHREKINIDLYRAKHTTINWFLNVKRKTIKLLEHTGKYLYDSGEAKILNKH